MSGKRNTHQPTKVDRKEEERGALHRRSANGDKWAALEALAVHLHNDYDRPLPFWIVEAFAEPLTNYLVANGRLLEHGFHTTSILMVGSTMMEAVNLSGRKKDKKRQAGVFRDPQTLSFEEHFGLRVPKRGQSEAGHYVIFADAYRLQQRDSLSASKAILAALDSLKLAQYIKYEDNKPARFNPPAPVAGGKSHSITFSSLLRLYKGFIANQKIADRIITDT